MTGGDIDAVAGIAYDAWLANRHYPEWFSTDVEDRVRQSFREFAEEPDAEVLIALEEDRVVGWGARDSRDYPGDPAVGWNYISDLWIDPQWQGRGVGSALLDEFLSRIRAESIDTATIEAVEANLGAIKLYRSKGFVEIWRGEILAPSLGLRVRRVRLEKSLA